MLVAAATACGGGGDDSDTASLIHRLLQASTSDQGGQLETFVGELPDSLPFDPPLYPGAELIVSSRQPASLQATPTPDTSGNISQPLLYLIVLDSGDSRNDVFDFYGEALEEDPWQILSTFSSEDVDTLQFSNVNDQDITGIVTIARGGDDNRTSVLISMQDAGAFREELPPYELGESVPVPPHLPDDVPSYDGATMTGSAFVREPGNESFLLIFLTEDTRTEVISYYRGEFQDRGWVVQDGAALGVEERIDFRDATGAIQGDVIVRDFARDASLSEVSLQFRQDPAREPGSEPQATPPPSTPTPAPAP